MALYRYIRYTDIPENSANYILSVTGYKTLNQLSLTEINNFLNDMEHWYGQYNSRLKRISTPTD